MAFRHRPVQELDVFPKGEYDAVVIRAAEKRSKKGNDMLEVMLKVFHPSGQTKVVYDYLVNQESMAFKIRHFCESAGLDYDAGEIDASRVSEASVRVRLAIQDDEFGKKNVVRDYVPRPNVPMSQQAAPFEVTDSDIPF